MTRPPKDRHVACTPEAVVYKPAGIPARLLEWVTLTLDEFEAIRRIDHEGQDQETAAAAMGVSRPTVTRIYGRARAKIAEVLVAGKALKIEGGPVVQVPLGRGRGMGRGMGMGRGFGRGRGRRGFGGPPQNNEQPPPEALQEGD